MNSFSTTPVNAGGPYREHREVPRFTLIASIEVREPESDMRIKGRISEISRKGCYVDVLNTLPEGTLLDVHISRDQGAFETKGKIVYVQPGMGMGVAFVETAPEQLKILDAWLAEMTP
ncbi:MAG: PilZ domain-containing protein [Candidatus Acidiferrales bacterium]|jgi:PilZ domain